MMSASVKSISKIDESTALGRNHLDNKEHSKTILTLLKSLFLEF